MKKGNINTRRTGAFVSPSSELIAADRKNKAPNLSLRGTESYRGNVSEASVSLATNNSEIDALKAELAQMKAMVLLPPLRKYEGMYGILDNGVAKIIEVTGVNDAKALILTGNSFTEQNVEDIDWSTLEDRPDDLIDDYVSRFSEHLKSVM